MDSQTAPSSPALTTSSYGILSPRSEFPHPPRARASTVSSTDSSSSFEFANAETASEGHSEESGDEIVWNLQRDHQNDDDDFVVLSRRSEVKDARTQVREKHEEGLVVTPRGSNDQEASLDDSLSHIQSSILSINTPGSQLRWADEKFDNEEVQKSSDEHQAASACNILSLPIPNVTPKRDVELGRRLLPSETPAQPECTAPLSAIDTFLPQLKAKAKKKKKKKKVNSKRKVQAKEISNVSGDGVKKGKKKKRGGKLASPPVELTTDATLVDSSIFQEAQDYISSFLSSSEARSNTVCRLTLLQSLIIELGLISSVLNLPSSLKAAKNFLKAKAFLNIGEYMSVRGQGRDAIRKALYPSRNALVKALRAGKNQRVSLRWVKDHGLQVLLVGCHFH